MHYSDSTDTQEIFDSSVWIDQDIQEEGIFTTYLKVYPEVYPKGDWILPSKAPIPRSPKKVLMPQTKYYHQPECKRRIMKCNRVEVSACLK